MYCKNCGAPNADTSAYCFGCGAPLSAPAKPVVQKKKSAAVWVWISIGATLTLIVAIILLTSLTTAKFKMNNDGSLYYNGHGSGPIEIPTAFDGRANSFADIGSLYNFDFCYAGTVEQFVSIHSWVFFEDYDRYESSKTITCRDGTITFCCGAGDTLGAEIVYYNGSAELINIRYKVELDGEEMCFEDYSSMIYWLDTQ